jgi:hypothetical protein
MQFFKAIHLILAFCLVAFPPLRAVAGDNICLLPNYPELIYDPGNPKNIAPGTSVTIKIIGGVPPFFWSTGTSGFSFAFNQTPTDPPANDGRSNILTAAANACGKVAVTITDSRPDPNNPGSLKPQTVHGYLNEDYQPLKYVYPENEADQRAAPGGSAVVSISGGTPPYTYELSDAHFSFSYTPGDISATTNATSITVLNLDNGCVADVIVTDQCDTVRGSVRGTGQWEGYKPRHEKFKPAIPNGCEPYFDGYTGYRGWVYEGKIRIYNDHEGFIYQCRVDIGAGPPSGGFCMQFQDHVWMGRCGNNYCDRYFIYTRIAWERWICNGSEEPPDPDFFRCGINQAYD